MHADVARGALADAGLATSSAKKRYQRTRPFVYNQQPSCTPEDEAKLAADGSYPSGHSALGWGWALLLAGTAGLGLLVNQAADGRFDEGQAAMAAQFEEASGTPAATSPGHQK